MGCSIWGDKDSCEGMWIVSYEICVLNDFEKSLICVSIWWFYKGRGVGIGGLKWGEIIIINCGCFRIGNNI